MKLFEMQKMLTVAFSQWPRQEPTESVVKMWALAFQDSQPETFWQAMLNTLKTSRSGFPPTIGEVNHALQAIIAPQQLTEGEAWGLAMKAVRQFGTYQEGPAFEFLAAQSADVRNAVALLGWRQVCGWRIDDEPANRAHFWKILLGNQKRDLNAALIGGQVQPKLVDIVRALGCR